MSNWKEQAIALAKEGLSWREVARVLGMPKSTVSDALRLHFKGYINSQEKKVESTSPKILFIDIETSSLSLAAFSMFNVNASLEQLEGDWNILSFCAKWAYSEEIIYYDLREQTTPTDDRYLCEKLWELLDDSDFVIGHNSKRFDSKKIFARMFHWGMSKPKPFRQIDTLEIAKR